MNGAMKYDFQPYPMIFLPKWKFWFSSIKCSSSVLSQIVALQAACHPTKYDVINDVKLFPSQIFYIIQSDVALQKQVH